MKNNYDQVQTYILQALKFCNDDNSLREAKSYLSAALQSVSKASNKKDKRVSSQKADEKTRKTKHDEWWEMVKKNAANNINLGLSEE